MKENRFNFVTTFHAKHDHGKEMVKSWLKNVDHKKTNAVLNVYYEGDPKELAEEEAFFLAQREALATNEEAKTELLVTKAIERYDALIEQVAESLYQILQFPFEQKRPRLEHLFSNVNIPLQLMKKLLVITCDCIQYNF